MAEIKERKRLLEAQNQQKADFLLVCRPRRLAVAWLAPSRTQKLESKLDVIIQEATPIEAVLSAHHAVELAQVIGIPDPRLEEVPAAYVKLSGESAATATAPDC